MCVCVCEKTKKFCFIDVYVCFFPINISLSKKCNSKYFIIII